MKNKTLLIGVVGIIVIGIIVTGIFLTAKPAFRNEVINPPGAVADINATDDDGNLFKMSNMRGKVVLLFFGYTNCPDECPLTLAHIKQALDTLGTTSQNVEVVMVSTDPVRDTPQVVNNYLNAFNPAFIGITGSPDDLAKIYQDYGVVVLDGGETHSSFTYVIDQKGQLRLTFLPDTTPEDIAHDLKIILAGN